MAVLKRFSYDNIVEHNPTAPDPVEGGGSGRGGLFLIALTEEGEEGNETYTANRTYSEIIDAINAGQLPVLIRNGIAWLYLTDKFAFSFPGAPPASLAFWRIAGKNQDGNVLAERCVINKNNVISYERS